MAETKLRLVDIDETINDPRTDKGRIAAGVREGRRREKAEQTRQALLIATKHQGELDGLKSAHLEELNRSGRIVARAAHRDGVLQGLVGGMLLAVALAFSTWIILREVVITNVATQRVPVPGDGVPELIDREQRAIPYQGDRREPGNAPQ